MNNREFAAAHDRYLDPPDEDFDDTEEDECDLADIERQKQIDKEDWQAYQQQMKDDNDGL